VSEKVVRATVSADVRWIGTCKVEGPQCVQWHIPTFNHGDKVVVIPEDEYARLKRVEVAWDHAPVLPWTKRAIATTDTPMPERLQEFPATGEEESS
jgi:hypothetical protein